MINKLSTSNSKSNNLREDLVKSKDIIPKLRMIKNRKMITKGHTLKQNSIQKMRINWENYRED